MGTWDDGLLDNDAAADELWNILHDALADVRNAATQDLTPERAGRLAAELALVIHYEQVNEDDHAAEMRAGVERNRAVLAKVAPKAVVLISQIARDEVPENPPWKLLFEAKHAAVYLQPLADASLEEIEDCLEEQHAGAHLDVLTVLAPYVELRAKSVRHLARRVRELVDEADDEDAQQMHAYTKACKTLLTFCSDDDDDDDD